MANRADPRIDSDNSRTLGNSAVTGAPTAQTSGISSGTGQTTTSGPHTSNLANQADPRIDSDNSRIAGTSGVTGSNPSSGRHAGYDNTSAVGTGQGSHLSRENDRNLASNPGYTGTESGVTGANQSSGHHLGRDAAAVGTAGAVGEGIHHHDQHQGNLGSSTGQTGVGSTGQTLPHHPRGGVTGTNQSSGNHLGRDAAATGAVGEGIHHHDQHQGNLGSSTGHTSIGSTGQSYPQNTGASGTNQSSGHHLGRDAAALGTAGAVGEGVHHHQHQGNTGVHTGQNLPQNTQSGVTGTNTGSGQNYGRDATAVGTAGALGEGAHHHHQGNTGTYTGSTGQGVSGTNQGSGNHLGRDAAALGTAGAVGEGVHHHHNQGTAGSNTGLTGSTGAYHTGPTGSAVQGVSLNMIPTFHCLGLFWPHS